MFNTVYIMSVVVCLLIGIVGGYLILKEEQVKIKEFVLGTVIALVVSIIPLVNTFAIILLIGATVSYILEDDDDKHWWNKTIGGKTISTGPK